MLAIKKSPKNRKTYVCKKCDYDTCNKYDFVKHNNTEKHISNNLSIIDNDFSINLSQKSQKHNYMCSICNKVYKDNSGLWRHKKKCKEEIIESIPAIDKDLIMLLIKENSELKHMMIEQQNMILEIAKNGTHNNTTNSHNKSFNLQFFLNETCKDAINITDFVNSLQLQLSDLERVGELGYVEGISKIIINNLKDLDITLRPVHCTDKKRETIYVKDEDKWEKDEEKKKMHKLIKRVADKNARMLPNFKERYPDYNKSSSNVSDLYNKILIESMGGPGDNDYEKEEKIIKRVSKEVIVEKI
jgi:hypothetical protein